MSLCHYVTMSNGLSILYLNCTKIKSNRCHHPGTIISANPAAVFIISVISNVMNSIFDLPMEASLSLRDLMDSEKAHQVFRDVYTGLNTLYNVYTEKELNHGFCDLVLEPLLANHPGIKYSYLIELKYIRPDDFEKEDREERIQALRLEAETQLAQYSLDEKFRKSIGQTTLKKLVLIFSGNRMVHHSEI